MFKLPGVFGGESEHTPPQYSLEDVEKAKATSPKASSSPLSPEDHPEAPTSSGENPEAPEAPPEGIVAERTSYYEDAESALPKRQLDFGRVEDYLKERHLGKFTKNFLQFGIENLDQLLNREVLTDAVLANELGMNLVEIKALYDPPPVPVKPSASAPKLQMLFKHKNPNRLKEIEDGTAEDSGKHEGYSTFCLFVRKLRKGMHYIRVAGDGSHSHTMIAMKANNQGIKFFTSGRRVDLKFQHLTSVVDLEKPLWEEDDDDDPTNDTPPEQVAVRKLLGDDPDLISRAFLLVFQDGEDDGDAVGDKDLAALPEKYATASAVLRLAKLSLLPPPKRAASMLSKLGLGSGGGSEQLPSSSMDRGTSPADQVRASQLAKEEKARKERAKGKSPEEVAKMEEKYLQRLTGLVNGPTVEANGMDCLLLLANSRESKHVAVNGYNMAADFAHDHSATAPDLVAKKKHPEWLVKLEEKHPWLVKVLQAITDFVAWVAHLSSFFHTIYRPHHQFNHPPPRFHAGVDAEVLYDDSLYVTVEHDGENAEGSSSGGNSSSEEKPPKVVHFLRLPCPVFRPGMFLKARITDYDDEKDVYTLRYLHGPYLGQEAPDHTEALSVKDHPEAEFTLHNVKGAFLSVDMSDNYGSAFPTFLLAVSAVQTFCFFFYVFNKSNAPLTATSPVGGPSDWWMQVIGDFPSCKDLRPQWWRLWSYQLVHQGSSHIVYNMIMQILFGLPINMVHGNLRFFFMYELGVVGGSLCFVLIGGGQNSLVGCSGGVYAIFGIHVAELVMNWDSNKKGIMNHWTRLFIMAAILGLDFYLYLTGPSHTTSYTAHVGGFLMGAAMGIVFLQNLEVTWVEANVIVPGAYVITAVILIWACTHYAVYWPPQAAMWPVDQDSCCVQMIDCGGLSSSDYSLFSCSGGVDVRKRTDGRGIVNTCAEMEDYASSVRAGR